MKKKIDMMHKLDWITGFKGYKVLQRVRFRYGVIWQEQRMRLSCQYLVLAALVAENVPTLTAMMTPLHRGELGITTRATLGIVIRDPSEEISSILWRTHNEQNKKYVYPATSASILRLLRILLEHERCMHWFHDQYYNHDWWMWDRAENYGKGSGSCL